MAVARKARKDGIDVAVRIGVHTGRVTGGIIGTLRFHFDMWGAGVNGAVRMEEAGERSRVHVSGARLSTCPAVHVSQTRLLVRVHVSQMRPPSWFVTGSNASRAWWRAS